MRRAVRAPSVPLFHPLATGEMAIGCRTALMVMELVFPHAVVDVAEE